MSEQDAQSAPPLDPGAQALMAQILHDAPAAQELWTITLDVLEGLVVLATARGWHEAHARAMVAHRFCSGV